MNYLHNNLSRLRKYHNMTQADAAERLGIARSRYAGWESGAAEPSINMLINLRDMYKVGFNVMLVMELTPLSDDELDRLMKP